MERVKTVYLVRHGQTEWNVERRMQGQKDSPLTALGQHQAKASGAFLAPLGIEKIYASPLGRVRQTLQFIEETLDAPAQFDDRLQEWNSGEWSSHLFSELHWRWPDHFEAWDNDRFFTRPPGGENYPDMMERVSSFLRELENDPSKSIVILSHGMLGRAIMGVLLDLSPKEVLQVRQRNDVIVKITLSDPPHAEHYVGGDGPRRSLPTQH